MGETAAMFSVSPAEGRVKSTVDLLWWGPFKSSISWHAGSERLASLCVLGDNKLDVSTCEQHENRTFHLQ